MKTPIFYMGIALEKNHFKVSLRVKTLKKYNNCNVSSY